MTIERVAIKDVKPNPDNPRIIKDDKFSKLVQSIKDFPQMLDLRPIVVNADLMVLGGNMRLKACQAAGLTHVPIVRADTLTPEQQREFIIKDNVGFGEWDWDALANTWDAEQLGEWAVNVPWVNNGVAQMVNKGDESAEWVGMPEFEAADKAFKLVIQFEHEQTRQEFCQKTELQLGATGTQTWSTWWPIKPKTRNTERYE